MFYEIIIPTLLLFVETSRQARMRRARELPEKMTIRKVFEEMTHGSKGGIIPPSWQTPGSKKSAHSPRLSPRR
jgi:hypothetical protein